MTDGDAIGIISRELREALGKFKARRLTREEMTETIVAVLAAYGACPVPTLEVEIRGDTIYIKQRIPCITMDLAIEV